MAKRRSKKSSQLRGKRGFIKVWCKQHEWQKIPMLSPLACPRCSVERESSDLLQRPTPKRSNRKVSRNVSSAGVAENGAEQAVAFKRRIRRDL